MDLAEVYLNDSLVVTHDQPFTPFEAPVGHLLRSGENVLEVRVTDPSLDDPMHLRTAHGKQGWMNHVFPSRPSLYLTYGGIWQPVHLRRHGPVVVRDVFVNGDPDDLRVEVTVENRLARPVATSIGIRILGRVLALDAEVPARDVATVGTTLGSTTAPHWSPDTPILHDVVVDARVGGTASDVRHERFGLRTIRIDGSTILVDDAPYRMKSVLVQGFTADR